MDGQALVKYVHIIWDWNGTLLDDAETCVDILNVLLRKRGKDAISYEQYRDEFAFPVKAYYNRLGFDFEAERYDEVAREYIEIYYKRQFDCKLQDDAIATLRWCREEGVSQSILSAYNQQLLTEAVEFFGLEHFFVTLAGLDNHYAHSKVEAGKGLLRELGLSGERVLLVGDTTHDYETAKAMGTDCVLVGRGHHRHERLAACGVSVLNSLSEVPKILLQ